MNEIRLKRTIHFVTFYFWKAKFKLIASGMNRAALAA